MMARGTLAALPLLVALAPLAAQAQDMSQMDHSKMDHSAHGMESMSMPEQADNAASDPHAGHDMGQATVSDQPGDAPPPPVPADAAADRIFSAARMDSARKTMFDEMRFSTFALQVDRLEYRAANGRDGFGWEGEAWYGGDHDRVVLASEGEGIFGDRAERIELAGYWRHALDPWFNLQLGVRHDFRPDPQRTYALIGIQGLAPYWFEVAGQILVSNRGDSHARGTASYQQRITQSLVIEPETEFDFAFQDVPDLNVGAGFERIELGARLRYDRNRSFAPYLGVHWERKLGQTATIARRRDDGVSGVSMVMGVRAMF